MRKTIQEVLGFPVLFHVVLYQGKDGTPSPTGYSSLDPNTIGDQLTLVQRIGGDRCGVVGLTYGPTVNTFIHEASQELCQQCEQRQLPHMLCYDPWTVEGSATPKDPNAALIAAINHSDTQKMMSGRSYLNYRGLGASFLDFGTGATAAGLSGKIKQDPMLLHAAFSWPAFDKAGKPVNLQNSTPLPCLFSQFDDGTGTDRNKSVWDQTQPVRLWPANAGATFWQSVAQVPKGSRYAQYVTLNDVLEGTDLEKFLSLLVEPIGG